MRLWAFLLLIACTRENPTFFSVPGTTSAAINGTTTSGTTTSGTTTAGTTTAGTTTAGTTTAGTTTAGTTTAGTTTGGVDCAANSTTCKQCCLDQNPAGYQSWLNSIQTCECTILGVGSCASLCQDTFCVNTDGLSVDCESCIINDINVNGKCGATIFCLSDANCTAFLQCHDRC